MSFIRNTRVGTRPAPPDAQETTGGGPLTTTNAASTYRYNARRVPGRTRIEKIGFWVIVVAALALLLLLLGVILPPLVGGIINGAYLGIFVGGLTVLNLPRPSGWANSVLGRRVFPVLRASEGDIWRLAGTNAALTFVFAFFYHVVAAILGPFFGGLIVFGGLIAAGVFYNRARKVVIKP